MNPRPGFIAALVVVLFAASCSGCALIEETACGELDYRNGMCEGFEGMTWVRRAPRIWVPGAR